MTQEEEITSLRLRLQDTEEERDWFVKYYNKKRGAIQTARYLRVIANNAINPTNIKPDHVKALEKVVKLLLDCERVSKDDDVSTVIDNALDVSIKSLETITGNSYKGRFYK